MRVRHTPAGPFKERPYFSEDEIDALCVEELSKQGLLPEEPGPVRIDRFIEKRFGRAHGYADLQAGILGLTRFGASGVEEVVTARALEDDRSKPSERRLRSTLAHEAGHGLLHAYLFALGQQRPLLGDWSDKNAPKVLCRESGLKSFYKGDWWEYQANMVMGATLLPKPLVMKAIHSYLTPAGTFGIPTLTDSGRVEASRDLSDVFDVNPVVVQIRLDKLFANKTTGQMTL